MLFLNICKIIINFSSTSTVVYTIEFQKRGLPHVHIVLWLPEPDKCTTPDQIDEIICAEIPDKEIDLIGYNTVSQFMVHGPCGDANPRCACMQKGVCTKHFLKPFHNETIIDNNGYVLYKRRDDGRVVKKNGVLLDNRYITLTLISKDIL